MAIAQLLLDGSWIVSVRDPPIREFENSKKAMYTFGPTDPTSTTSASRLVQRALDNTQKLQELVMRFSFDVERIDPKSRTFSGSEAADWFLNELNLNPAWASDVRWSHNDVVALLQLLQDLHCIRRSASISRTFRASSDAKYTLVDVTQLYITLIKRRTGARRIGEAAAIEGFSPKHPILIIPGLASSALEVWESSIQPEWKGERVWLDIGKVHSIVTPSIDTPVLMSLTAHSLSLSCVCVCVCRLAMPPRSNNSLRSFRVSLDHAHRPQAHLRPQSYRVVAVAVVAAVVVRRHRP